MKKAYIKPTTIQVMVSAQMMIAVSNVPLKNNLSDSEQNDVNTSMRVKQRDAWDQQW
jgi:hypothetical protein